MGSFAVAGIQLDLESDDNLERIGEEVAAAKRRLSWLDMIVLPELCAYGPKIAHAEPLGGRAETFFQQIARDNQVWLMPGSIYQIENGKVFNVAPVIDPAGTVRARYRKMFPFRPYEEGVAGGDAFCVLPIAGAGTLGVSICYDLWFPETTRSLVWMGAEALICPTLTNTIDRDVERAMARATAAGNQCYVVSVNTGAPMGVGRSIVCGPGGEVIHQAGAGYEVFAFDIDFDLVTRVRREGWQGLGQPLKSFRDNAVRFPPYQAGAISPALNDLGPVAKRNSNKSPP